MTVYTERSLCDAIIIAPTEGCIRRCNRTAQAGGAMCEKHKGTEAWQATLHKVLVPNWADLIRVAPAKRAALTVARGPSPTLRVQRPVKAAAAAVAAPVPTKPPAPPLQRPTGLQAPPARPNPAPKPQPVPAPIAAPTYRDKLAAFVGRKGDQ
jgi:hypothetical protein